MERITTVMKQSGLSMEVDREAFALSLKTWRLRIGLTQQEVGKRWNCSRWTIIRAEKGRQITWEMAYRLFAKLSEELKNEHL